MAEAALEYARQEGWYDRSEASGCSSAPFGQVPLRTHTTLTHHHYTEDVNDAGNHNSPLEFNLDKETESSSTFVYNGTDLDNDTALSIADSVANNMAKHVSTNQSKAGMKQFRKLFNE